MRAVKRERDSDVTSVSRNDVDDEDNATCVGGVRGSSPFFHVAASRRRGDDAANDLDPKRPPHGQREEPTARTHGRLLHDDVSPWGPPCVSLPPPSNQPHNPPTRPRAIHCCHFRTERCGRYVPSQPIRRRQQTT